MSTLSPIYLAVKRIIFLLLVTFSSYSTAEWVEYSIRPNGDILFYDDARLEKNGNQISVWSRILYKTSLMGAFSYQNLLRIDCLEKSVTNLQRTFYSDKNWTTPAMATNTKPKRKKYIKANSATQQLADRVCKG